MSVGPFGSGSFGTSVFSNSPFYSTKTLIDAVLRDTSHADPAVEVTKRQRVLSFLNNRYAAITTLQAWEWLYQELDVAFDAPYITGTLSMTVGSTDVVGTGTVFSSNAVPNNYLYAAPRNEVYLISDVVSQTELTLESVFAGPTQEDVPCNIIKPIYTMPADCENLQSVSIQGYGELVPLGRQEFTRKKQYLPGNVGIPRFFTQIGKRAQDGVGLYEVYPAPDQAYNARLYYGVNVISLSDSVDSYPLIPDRYRHVLYLGAMADMYAFLRDKVMADRNDQYFLAALNNMKNDKQLTDSRVVLQPARNYRNKNAGRLLRYSYSINDFARLDD